MKDHKWNLIVLFALVFILSSFILEGCENKSNVNVTSSKAEPADTPIIYPTVTPTITLTVLTDETAIEEVNKDIDGNGVNAFEFLDLDGDNTKNYLLLQVQMQMEDLMK